MDQQKIVNTCISYINEWSIYIFKFYALLLLNIGVYQWVVLMIRTNFCEVILMLQASFCHLLQETVLRAT